MVCDADHAGVICGVVEFGEDGSLASVDWGRVWQENGRQLEVSLVSGDRFGVLCGDSWATSGGAGWEQPTVTA